MTIKARITVGLVLLCVAGVGYGSSGGAPGDGGATRDTGVPANGVLTWKEGGTAHSAPFAAAAMARSSTYTGTEGEMFTCAIELTSIGTVAGAHAVGRFSATLGLPGGGTKVITDGQFDIPATVSTL